jgi:hypothetical protein
MKTTRRIVMMDRGKATSAALAYPLSASGTPIELVLRQPPRVWTYDLMFKSHRHYAK